MLRFRMWGFAAAAVLLTSCSQNSTAPVASTAPAPATAPVAQSKVEVPEVVAPKPEPPKPVVLAAGTNLNVRTTTQLSTKIAMPGDVFVTTLTKPLVVAGKAVAAAGAEVEGVVVESDPGGKVKGLANISVRLTRLHAGKRSLAIRTNTIAREAKATKKKDALKVGIGAGIGAAIGAAVGGGEGAAIGAASGGGAGGAVVLATHGDPAVIPSESLLTFKLRGPVTVSN